MKNKGIVRRLDSLGRIVIPREFRKLHKINLGDPLEITTLDSGEIILHKVDLTAEFITAAAPALEQLNLFTNNLILAVNSENYIVGIGANRLAYVGMELSGAIKKLVENKNTFSGLASECGLTSSDYIAVVPVVGDLDIFGAFIMMSAQEISNETMEIFKLVATIVGKSLQKF